MPTIRITMRHIRETLRLHEQAGLPYGEIACALKIANSSVGKYVLLARTARLDWRAAGAVYRSTLET